MQSIKHNCHNGLGRLRSDSLHSKCSWIYSSHGFCFADKESRLFRVCGFCRGMPMRWTAWTLCLLAGCWQPLRTDSRLRVDGPVNVSATIEPKNNASPLQEMAVPGYGSQGPKIALIDVDGLLLNQNLTGPYSAGDNPVDLFKERLDAAANDPCVCAVVVRINSPGGAVTAVDIMWQELQAFRMHCSKPIVTCLMDLGTSGGYYLAT